MNGNGTISIKIYKKILYTNIYTYIRIYTYIHIHTHTYTHTYTYIHYNTRGLHSDTYTIQEYIGTLYIILHKKRKKIQNANSDYFSKKLRYNNMEIYRNMIYIKKNT